MATLNSTNLSPNGPQLAGLLRRLQFSLKLSNPVISVSNLLEESALHCALLAACGLQFRGHGSSQHVEALVVLLEGDEVLLRLLVVIVNVLELLVEGEGGSSITLCL